MPPVRKTFTPIPDALAPDHTARLMALRDRLTDELATAPTAYVAGIARQLQAVLAVLAAAPDPTATPSEVDEIDARRAARLAGGPS